LWRQDDALLDDLSLDAGSLLLATPVVDRFTAIRVVDVRSGQVLWSRPLPVGMKFALAQLAPQQVLTGFPQGSSTVVAGYRMATPVQRWRVQLPGVAYDLSDCGPVLCDGPGSPPG
jgi:hypothetical protein